MAPTVALLTGVLMMLAPLYHRPRLADWAKVTLAGGALRTVFGLAHNDPDGDLLDRLDGLEVAE